MDINHHIQRVKQLIQDYQSDSVATALFVRDYYLLVWLAAKALEQNPGILKELQEMYTTLRRDEDVRKTNSRVT